MIRFFILKFKRSFYLSLLFVLNIAAILISPGCNSTESKKVNNVQDSIQKMKRVTDSIAEEKRIKDSITDIRRINDSISRVDSIKKSKRVYEHKIQNTKYGVIRTDYKNM
jgi:hypothetical protein